MSNFRFLRAQKLFSTKDRDFRSRSNNWKIKNLKLDSANHEFFINALLLFRLPAVSHLVARIADRVVDKTTNYFNEYWRGSKPSKLINCTKYVKCRAILLLLLKSFLNMSIRHCRGVEPWVPTALTFVGAVSAIQINLQFPLTHTCDYYYYSYYYYHYYCITIVTIELMWSIRKWLRNLSTMLV